MYCIYKTTLGFIALLGQLAVKRIQHASTKGESLCTTTALLMIRPRLFA